MAVVHEHAALIDALGGAAKIAKYISEETGKTITPQGVSMWKGRGIAEKYRRLIVKLARSKRKSNLIPAGFILGDDA